MSTCRGCRRACTLSGVGRRVAPSWSPYAYRVRGIARPQSTSRTYIRPYTVFAPASFTASVRHVERRGGRADTVTNEPRTIAPRRQSVKDVGRRYTSTRRATHAGHGTCERALLTTMHEADSGGATLRSMRVRHGRRAPPECCQPRTQQHCGSRKSQTA